MTTPNRILIVDDEPSNLILLGNILESLGHEAVSAGSGSGALEKLSPEIDLVLLDVMMPSMDGFEVARRIRATQGFAELPIIMVTVLASREDRLKAVQAGANDFITKPIDKLELSVRMASLLKMKEAQDRIRASLKEKETLLREVHHRVKNNLSMVASMLRLQSRRVEEGATVAMFEQAAERVASMSLVHEKLYQSKDLASIRVVDYLEDLVRQLFVTYGSNSPFITLETNIEDVAFGTDTAIPLALMLTELVANCLKHAFPDKRDGVIRIQLHSAEPDGFELRVDDNGVGFPEGLDVRRSKSLGLDLVRIFTRQLHGEMKISEGKGARVSIKFKTLGTP